MFSLLQIEWLKIKRYRTFWVLTGIFIVFILGWNWLMSAGVLTPGGNAAKMLGMNFTFPDVWFHVGHNTKLFSGLMSILVIILTTNEYQFRTNRQNVIDGWQRTQFFHAQWSIVFVLSLLITLYTLILGLFFGLLNGSPLSAAGTNIQMVGYVFLLCMNYFGLALTLSFLLKRSGMTIVIFLCYGYIAETMITNILRFKFDTRMGDLLPMESAANLLAFHLPDMAKQMMGLQPTSASTLCIASVCWTVVYYIISRIKVLKSDW